MSCHQIMAVFHHSDKTLGIHKRNETNYCTVSHSVLCVYVCVCIFVNYIHQYTYFELFESPNLSAKSKRSHEIYQAKRPSIGLPPTNTHTHIHLPCTHIIYLYRTYLYKYIICMIFGELDSPYSVWPLRCNICIKYIYIYICTHS